MFAPGKFLPTVVVGAVSGRTGSGVVLNGKVAPEGFKLTECEFEIVSEGEWEAEGFSGAGTRMVGCEPAAGSIGVSGETPVTGRVSGLTAGVAYRYRLVAHSEGELGGTVESQALAFTTPEAPGVEASGAERVSSGFVDLVGRVDPRGLATSYFFQYGPTVGYGLDAPVLSEEAPLGEAIGAGGATGSVIEGVVQHVGGLAAGSTYHFRLVAVNAAGTSYGPDETFTTLPEPVPGLPDGRAFELVTPADKQGGSDMFSEAGIEGYITNEQSTGTPSLAGAGFLLETRSAFGPFPGAFVSEYAFERHPPTGSAGGGWSYVSLAAPGLGVQAIGETVTLGGSFGVFDPVDLSRFAFTDGVGAEVSEAGDRPTDLVGVPGGPYTTLHVDPAFTENEGQTHLETKVVGGSEDVGVVVLESNDTGACAQPKGVGAKVEEGDVLCEWDGGFETPEGGGAPVPLLRLVSLAPGSESKPVSSCGAFLGAGTKPIQGGTRGAVSADGGVIVFTAPMVDSRAGEALTGAGCWNPVEEQKKGVAVHPPQVYASVRETQPAGEVTHETLRLSTPMEGVKEGGGTPREYPAQYIGASQDGSRVFFVSEAWLTADHPTVHDRELYECLITSETVGEHVIPKCSLTRISKGSPGSEAEHGGAMVDWAPVISQDGTVAYFSAFHALAEGATPQTPHSNKQEGEVNVYRYDTTTATTSYIATVNTQDFADEPTCRDELGSERAGPCTTEEWYTTPDGQYLLFRLVDTYWWV